MQPGCKKTRRGAGGPVGTVCPTLELSASCVSASDTPQHGARAPIFSRVHAQTFRSRERIPSLGRPDETDGDERPGHSDAQRFYDIATGKPKASLGFGPQHVFHSIRKTVVTILENAGVLGNVVADIVGHEKATMTYGLYSGGVSLAVKREALAKLTCPFAER